MNTNTMKILTTEAMDTIKNTCELHHTAWTRGYVSRKSNGFFEKYNGRYGKGYVVYTPAWNSTWYCYKTYYIYK